MAVVRETVEAVGPGFRLVVILRTRYYRMPIWNSIIVGLLLRLPYQQPLRLRRMRLGSAIELGFIVIRRCFIEVVGFDSGLGLGCFIEQLLRLLQQQYLQLQLQSWQLHHS